MDSSVRTDCSDSSSSSLSSDEEIILSREDYYDELQFYCGWKDTRLAPTHVEQMELFMRTVQNGDYDDEMELDLRENHNQFDFTEPAAEVLPAEWEEKQRIEKDRIKTQLQKFTLDEAGRRHSKYYGDDLDVRSYIGGSGREPLGFVTSDESIHHHWEKLVAAYCMPNNRGRQLGINIINVEIAKESMALLASSLAGRISDWCSAFKFNNNNLCREGMMSLLTLVENNQKMITFTLENNRIDDINVAMSLSNVLKSHTNIRYMYLNHCNLGNNANILSLILQSNVESIKLIGNNIDSSGAIKIAEFLKSNTKTTGLDLEFNLLNDDDAVVLAEALKVNTKLGWINLESNRFTVTGIKALIKSIYDCSSLNAIFESNHTLGGLYLFQKSSHVLSYDKFRGDSCARVARFCLERLIKLNRTKKLLIALHDKDSLLRYLAHMPMQLMPEVLEFLQLENNLRKRMSMMYCLMRWWNMPTLYSFNRTCSLSTKKRKLEGIVN
jgi:hypothetical protein